MRIRQFNRAQRIVIVIGLGAAFYAFGGWLTGLGSKLPYGWVAYAPLSKQFNTVGVHPWVRLVIWLVLVAVWVFTSLVLLRTGPPDRNGDN